MSSLSKIIGNQRSRTRKRPMIMNYKMSMRISVKLTKNSNGMWFWTGVARVWYTDTVTDIQGTFSCKLYTFRSRWHCSNTIEKLYQFIRRTQERAEKMGSAALTLLSVWFPRTWSTVRSIFLNTHYYVTMLTTCYRSRVQGETEMQQLKERKVCLLIARVKDLR